MCEHLAKELSFEHTSTVAEMSSTEMKDASVPLTCLLLEMLLQCFLFGLSVYISLGKVSANQLPHRQQDALTRLPCTEMGVKLTA